jgi:hypothetical protein
MTAALVHDVESTAPVAPVPAARHRAVVGSADRTMQVPADVRSVVRLLGLAGTVILLVGVVFVGLSPLLRAVTGDGHDVDTLTKLLNPDGEANVWAWYNATLLTLLAVVFAVDAMRRRAAGLPFLVQGVMAAVAGYLSLDEIAQLHEKLERPGDLLGLGWTWGWVVLAAPIAVVVGAGLLWLARRLDRTIRRRLVVAGAVYLTGALGLEAIGGVMVKLWHPAFTSPIYLSEVFVEEWLEMTGILIALGAALSAMALDRAVATVDRSMAAGVRGTTAD